MTRRKSSPDFRPAGAWVTIPKTDSDKTTKDRRIPDQEFKACCARFYADDLVARILGESFHPGGRELTRQLLDEAILGPEDKLLDVAAGPGASSILAAREYGCRVCALDLSEKNLNQAAAEAEAAGLSDRFETRTADAEQLPFEDETFDVVLCECAFCTFRNRRRAAEEMFRVLKPGGRIALSDMALAPSGLPEELDTLILKVACIADAVTEETLMDEFRQAGFSEIAVGDASWGLTNMVEQIRKRLLAVKLASKLGKISLGGIDLDAGMSLAEHSLAAVRDKTIRYVTMTAKKEKG